MGRRRENRAPIDWRASERTAEGGAWDGDGRREAVGEGGREGGLN